MSSASTGDQLKNLRFVKKHGSKAKIFFLNILNRVLENKNIERAQQPNRFYTAKRLRENESFLKEIQRDESC